MKIVKLFLFLLLMLLALPAAVLAQFNYATNNGTITITGYTGPNSGAINVPSEINGLPVTSIGYQAFFECTGLNSVMLGTNVTSIGDYAFEFCGKLSSCTLPNRLTNIGDSAFYDTALTNVMIPPSVTSIGTAAFYSSNLKTITVDAQNSVYSSANGVLFDLGQTTLIEYPNGNGVNYTIPNTVTSIGPNAFHGASVTNVIIPSSVTNIGDLAFEFCGNLLNVLIPSSVTSIGGETFAYCNDLTSVTIPNSVTSMGNSFFQCTGLTNVIIGSGLPVIGDYAFDGCSSLTSVTIPNNVTNIAIVAFGDCTNLTSVTIGSGVRSIADLAFQNCPRLTHVYFQGNAPSIDALSNVFQSDNATVYYLQGTTGWSTTFSGLPTEELISLMVTTASLLNGTTNVAYSQTLTATGGNPPYSWSLISGSLPPGLTLVTNGVISGTPIFTGTNSFIVMVTDATNSTATQALSLTVYLPPQITTASLANGTNGLAYSQTLTATGGKMPYNWTSISGTLPTGFTLTTNGLISGTPTANGTFNFTVEVTDALSTTATQALSLAIFNAQSQYLYVADGGDNTIQKIQTGGTNITFVNTGNIPDALAFDSGGNLFVANYASGIGDGTIQKFTPDGAGSIVATNLDGPAALAFDSAGDMYVANYAAGFGDGTIQEYTQNGVLTIATNLNGPTALTFDTSGNLYVADYSDNTILEFTNGVGDPSIFASIESPTALAFDTSSNLYVADSGNNTIQKITPDGVQTTFVNTGDFPIALAFDVSGNLCEANGDNNIEVFTPDGEQLPDYATGLNGPIALAFSMPLNPLIQTGGFGVQNNQFGFNIIGTSNLVIVVEACTNLVNSTWTPISTNTLNTFIGTNGTSYFSDPQWTNYPGRFYRLRSP